jgi:cob(I)alamin adenosyltransferase
MSEEKFHAPRIATIHRVYTKSGDRGETGLVGGHRRPKDDPRIEAYGTLDELNSFIGLARQSVLELSHQAAALAELAAILLRVQHELFNAESALATLPEDLRPGQPLVTAAECEQLEREIDRMNEHLPALRSFVLPGASRLDAELHICRTVCRRAERVCVTLARVEEVDGVILQYLNRLSDALFVWGRWAGRQLGVPENLWEPNASSSGHAE